VSVTVENGVTVGFTSSWEALDEVSSRVRGLVDIRAALCLERCSFSVARAENDDTSDALDIKDSLLSAADCHFLKLGDGFPSVSIGLGIRDGILATQMIDSMSFR
jgi:hypothetical protein